MNQTSVLMSEYEKADSIRRTQILIELSRGADPTAVALIEGAASREMPGVLWEWAVDALKRQAVDLDAPLDRFFSREAEFQREHWAWRNDDPDEWNHSRQQGAARFSRLRAEFDDQRRAARAASLVSPWLDSVADQGPDFATLRSILAKSNAEQRRAAWEHVAGVFHRTGHRQLANKCAVEALLSQPTSTGKAWRAFDFAADDRLPADLVARIRRYPRPTTGRDRSATEQLIVKLSKVVGLP